MSENPIGVNAVLRLVVLLTEPDVPPMACTEQVRVPSTLQSTTSEYSVLVAIVAVGTLTHVYCVPLPLQQCQDVGDAAAVSKPTPTNVSVLLVGPAFCTTEDMVRVSELSANHRRRLAVVVSVRMTPLSFGRYCAYVSV